MKIDISKEDLDLVVDTTCTDAKTATKALQMSKGDIALAILYVHHPKEYGLDIYEYTDSYDS